MKYSAPEAEVVRFDDTYLVAVASVGESVTPVAPVGPVIGV